MVGGKYVPRFRCSSSRANNAFLAPRSLNDPVACCHSCFRKMFIPVTDESCLERTSGVRTTPFRMRKCAVLTSSNAGRSWPLTISRLLGFETPKSQCLGSPSWVSESDACGSFTASHFAVRVGGRIGCRDLLEPSVSFRPRTPRNAGRVARGVPDSAPAPAYIQAVGVT